MNPPSTENYQIRNVFVIMDIMIMEFLLIVSHVILLVKLVMVLWKVIVCRVMNQLKIGKKRVINAYAKQDFINIIKIVTIVTSLVKTVHQALNMIV